LGTANLHCVNGLTETLRRQAAKCRQALEGSVPHRCSHLQAVQVKAAKSGQIVRNRGSRHCQTDTLDAGLGRKCHPQPTTAPLKGRFVDRLIGIH